MSGVLRRPPVLRPRVVRMTTGFPSRVSPSLPSVASYSATWSAIGGQALGSYTPSSGIDGLRSLPARARAIVLATAVVTVVGSESCIPERRRSTDGRRDAPPGAGRVSAGAGDGRV